MGVLKDALVTAVMNHLRTQRNNQTLILSLNAPNGIGPAEIRTTWKNLQDNGKDEGMSKAKGLSSVLKERLDIFYFHTNERAHNLITLTPSALALDAGSPLPPLGPAYNPPPQPAADPLTALAIADSEPAKKKAKKSNSQTCTAGAYHAPLKGQGKHKHGGYQDIVWTPQMAEHNDVVRAKDAEMARALFNACELHGGQRVTIGNLGANYEVAKLKKDPQFRNHKLIDICRVFDKVFDLVPDPMEKVGGLVINLHPGAGAGLPDAETWFDVLTEADLMLPEKLTEPRSQSDKMQALRIELVHVLHKRGGQAQLNELGQDQTVQRVKTGLPKALKLIEFIRTFPSNFNITASVGGLMDVTLITPDVYDRSMIESQIERVRAATERFREKGCGKGGGGGGGRDNPRSSSSSVYDAQQQLAQSPQQQYLNALAAQQLAAVYGAYGQAAVGQPGYPQGFSALPPPAPGSAGSQGFGFGSAI